MSGSDDSSIPMIRPDPVSNGPAFVEYLQQKNQLVFSAFDPSRPLHRNLIGKSTLSESAVTLLMESLRKEVAESRKIMSLILIKADLAKAPFEEEWSQLSEIERREIATRTIVFLSTQLNAEVLFDFAPEIVSLEEICSMDGRGFLRLLDHFRIHDIDINSTIPLEYPILRSEKVWELYGLPESEGSDLVLAKRHRILSLFVCHLLGQFYHLPASVHRLSVTNEELRSSEEHQQALHVVRSMEPSLGIQTSFSLQLTHEESCAECGTSNKKLMVCVKCRDTVGRMHWYCSRECQVKAYKTGEHPHRLICGKILPPTTTSTPPAPIGSKLYTSKPTAELRLQIFCLNQPEPQSHYNFLKKGLRAPVSFNAKAVSSLFLQQRALAMSKQDVCAIGVMDLLLRTLGVDNIVDAKVQDWTDQLEKEYEVDIWICRNAVMNTPGLFEFIQKTTDAVFLEESSFA